MDSDNWIDKTLKKCRTVSSDTEIQGKLIAKLVEVCFENQQLSAKGAGTLFAAAFDLIISAEYYSKISHAGWLYCPENEPRLFFPFTNCCSRHAVEGKFFFHPSNKPTSGVIGTATARLLLLFYQAIFKYKGFDEIVLRGSEPVDAVIINRAAQKWLMKLT